MLNAGSKEDFEVVVGEKRRPTSMPPIQCTSSGQVDEIPVVGQHLNTILGPTYIASPFSEGQDDSCKLLVVHWTIAFRSYKLVRVEGDRKQGAIVVELRQDRTDGKVGGVGFSLERAGGVRVN